MVKNSMIWANLDYRAILKERIHELKKQGLELSKNKKLSFASISEELKIQQSYLSRGLHNESTHLNDDHFDSLLQILNFENDEQSYLWLLRQHATSQNVDRKKRLQEKIESQRKPHLTQTEEKNELPDNIEDVLYLNDPLHIIVHVALNIPEFKVTPSSLCNSLGISNSKLTSILDNLEKAEFISRSNGKITEVHQKRIHFGNKHPLMRSHQILLRTLSNSWIQKLDDNKKKVFSATFSSDERFFEDLEKHFNDFLLKLQEDSSKYPPRHVFQLNFDFLQFT